MGKILKYMTTIALAAVMLFGTMTTAFAVENSGQVVGNDQKGSITIHKYKMPDAENAFESNTETAVLKWIVFLKRQNRWQMLSFRLQNGAGPSGKMERNDSISYGSYE